MSRSLLMTFIFVAHWTPGADVRVPLDDATTIVFLNGASATDAIVSEESDPFFRVLSRIDIESRLGRSTEGMSKDETLAALKVHFRSAVVDWSPAEIERVSASCRRINQRTSSDCPSFLPMEWKFVKTDGSDEKGAAYTRSDFIVLPVNKFPAIDDPGGSAKLDRLVAHETCHVYGRSHPGVRARLFSRLGFAFTGPIEWAASLVDRRITNPDGPIADAVIRLKRRDGSEFDAAPILISPVDRFDPARGQGVFRYFRFGFVEVEQGNGVWRIGAADGSAPTVLGTHEVSGYFDQIGRNTEYIIGPDEILAENVAIGLTSSPDQAIPNPEIPRDLLEIIRESESTSGP